MIDQQLVAISTGIILIPTFVVAFVYFQDELIEALFN